MNSSQTPICSTNDTAEVLKALGHPVRLRIVQELAEMQVCCCADMCDCFSHSQSTISQHLCVLKDAGILNFEKQGTKSFYKLNHDALNKLKLALNEIFPLDKAENNQ